MHRLLVLGLLLIPACSFAGPIADTFRDGVFGLPWGAAAEQIETTLPSGKWTEIAGGLRFYTVRDGRPILGIERKPKNELMLALSSDGRLNSVTITFPTDAETYAGLQLRATEQFGSDQQNQQRASPDLSGPRVANFSHIWPDDEGLRVTLSNAVAGFSRMVALQIQNTNMTADRPTGFE